MDAKLRPLGDGVLVRVAKAEEKVGSIIVPDAAQKKPRKGEVLAVGPGTPLDQPRPYITAHGETTPLAETMRRVAVGPGDVVLFAEYAGTKVGDDLLILKESDLLAVEERANARSGALLHAEDVPPVSLDEALIGAVHGDALGACAPPKLTDV